MRRTLWRWRRRIAAQVLSALLWAAGAVAAAEGGGEGPSLELKLHRGETYLNQPVRFSATLLYPAGTVRNVEYPRLEAAEVTLAEFTLPAQGSAVRDGRELASYEFSSSLTPRKSGTLQIGPAELGLELLEPAAGSAGFFGATQARHALFRSIAVPLVVHPLPLEGRPADFTGAVGSFSVTRSATPATVRAADPVTVRTVIRGTGNIDAFSCSRLSVRGLKGYPPRANLTRESLSCEQVVIPAVAGPLVFPAARVSFFDPDQQRYRSAVSATAELEVVPAVVVGTASAPIPSPALPAPPPAPPAARPPAPSAAPVSAAAAALVALGGLAGLLVLRTRSRRGSATRPVSPAASLDPGLHVAPPEESLRCAERALESGDPDLLYTAIFRVLQSHVALSQQVLPAGVAVAPFPGPASGEPDPCRRLFQQCDRVRYGRHLPEREEMAGDLQALRDLIR